MLCRQGVEMATMDDILASILSATSLDSNAAQDRAGTPNQFVENRPVFIRAATPPQHTMAQDCRPPQSPTHAEGHQSPQPVQLTRALSV